MANSTERHYPTLVYRGHGPYPRSGGGYDYKEARNQEEFDAHLADGWFGLLAEAIDHHDSQAQPIAEPKQPKKSWNAK